MLVLLVTVLTQVTLVTTVLTTQVTAHSNTARSVGVKSVLTCLHLVPRSVTRRTPIHNSHFSSTNCSTWAKFTTRNTTKHRLTTPDLVPRDTDLIVTPRLVQSHVI